MPEYEKRKARIARLLATVSVLGISLGMFRAVQADDLGPTQQDKWMPNATGGANTPADVASPTPDAVQNKAATMTNSGGDSEQLKLDSYSSGGDRPSNELGSGSGAGKGVVNPNADYMKYDTMQGKFKGEGVTGPAVQNKLNQPDVIYTKQTAPTLAVPGAGSPNGSK